MKGLDGGGEMAQKAAYGMVGTMRQRLEIAMKKDLHPEYHFIKVVGTDGVEFVTRTTWGEADARLQLVIDSKNHPAYTGERKILDSMGRREKFMNKYGAKGA